MKVGNNGDYFHEKKGRGRAWQKKIWRERCLRCDRGFWADGKYNRICPVCKNVVRTGHTVDECVGNMAAAIYTISLE